MTAPTTTSAAGSGVTDLYPTRGATEVTVPRQDPVVWGAPDTPRFAILYYGFETVPPPRV